MDVDRELKAQLARALCAMVDGWIQADAASLMYLHQSEVSRLRNNELGRFSIERLVRLIAARGYDIRVELKAMPKRFATPRPQPTVRSSSTTSTGVADPFRTAYDLPSARHRATMADIVPDGNAIEEYRLVSENIRYQEQIFFANLTIFIALTAAAIAFLFAPDRAVRGWLTLAGETAGVLFTSVFWMSSTVFLYRGQHFSRRARILEQHAPGLRGFRQYSSMGEASLDDSRVGWLRPGAIAWHTLFASAMGFWLWRGSVDLGLKPWVLPAGAFALGLLAIGAILRRLQRVDSARTDQ